MNRIARTLTASAVALAAASVSVSAQETTLRLSNWLPPSHPIVKDIVVPWAEDVEEATEGRVTVEILDAALGPPPAHFDLAATGAADVTYAPHGYTPGRFGLTDIAELPLITPSSTALSVAYQRVHEEMLAEAGEHQGVKVLSVWTHGPGHLFTTGADVTPLDTVEGLKIRVGGPLPSQLAEQMGMVPLQSPSTQTYEVLSGGVADAIYFPYESVTFFNLDELLTKALRVDGGLYNTSFFMVMNQAKWESLSEEDQAAIDEVSGEALARMAGQAWDNADEAGLEAMEGSVEFHDATEEERAQIEAWSEPLYEEVRAKFEAKGVDFDAALEMLTSEAEKVASE
ncbi:TRAP transporter substrate-binding protein [Roseivivax sediminis]|uniref:TRAP-type C4-dicarboxylate transport system, substrate-binding protein n=1 Tax=Roseivivax sediminis TaxID=936889 RepID=A0A1I1Z6I9_9RHOB|nr:TRAP transporter substrate-binding protein [Roseivivax sediminis]SFE27406.1 TRAP-type C4-dicarboxylate transport system, substrate-binding protein [Roseivivax sediminis]